MFSGFDQGRTDCGGVEIAWVAGGAGPVVLLLHGFPQTHALWAGIAPRLVAAGYRVVAADLRGYGASGQPAWAADGASHSFRAMGQDMARLMTGLGHDRFHLIGHDRGARVAHRMALDHPRRVASLALMDIAPTLHLLEHFDLALGRAYWHWIFLAQPAPFPEMLIAHDPDAFFHACLVGWGAARLTDFDAGQLAAYRAAWRRPQVIAGMCADYRAAPIADLADDRADRDARVAAPTLILWGADGVMGRMYDMAALWRSRLITMEAATIPGGHFFPDTSPGATADRLAVWLATQGG